MFTPYKFGIAVIDLNVDRRTVTISHYMFILFHAEQNNKEFLRHEVVSAELMYNFLLVWLMSAGSSPVCVAVSASW
jgi:hypothetical protein